MLRVDLNPKHFRELKKLLYIIYYTFILCFMVDGMDYTYEHYESIYD
jgi:hypothetical protein